MKINKIIISRGRHKNIRTHKLLKECIVLVPDNEVVLYSERLKDVKNIKIEPIPKEKQGLSEVRNYVIDNYVKNNECVIMFDDDISFIKSLMGKKPETIDDKDIINDILLNLTINAYDSGAKLFGFTNASTNIRLYKENEPFGLSSWIGGIIGVFKNDLRFDETNKLKCDIDYCLQHLLKYRIIWIENRFCFVQRQNNNKGGNSLYRTQKRLKQETAYLKAKWGKYFKVKKTKTKERTSTYVKRRQIRIQID